MSKGKNRFSNGPDYIKQDANLTTAKTNHFSPFTVRNSYSGINMQTVIDYIRKRMISAKRPMSGNSGKITVPKELLLLLSAAEEGIKEFYSTIRKKVLNFLENDLPKLTAQSREEMAKTSALLTEYLNSLQKVSEEKLKYIGDLKTQMQSKIMTADEMQTAIKYLESKMTEVKRLTAELLNRLPKKDMSVFLKELQSFIEQNGSKTKLTDIITAAQKITKSIIGENSITSKISKLPKSAKFQKVPAFVISGLKIFRKDPSNAKQRTGTIIKRPAIPFVKEKLQFLNFGKRFHSDVIPSRVNVMKATYAGIIAWCLYRKVKNAKQ